MSRLVALLIALGQDPVRKPVEFTFGTTVVSASVLEGKVYFIKEIASGMPNFEKLKPQGTIYTDALNIAPQAFTVGFPGISDRNEWFGIDYTGRIWIDIEDEYHFDLGSDDGSRLYLDDKLVIDNEGIHAPERVKGSAVLTRGVHKIRVTYFQGPRFSVALVLGVARGKEQFKLFRTRDFQPPKDGQELMPGEIRKIKKGTRPIGAL